MRRRIRITESQLRRTVNEAVRGLLRESEEDAAYASWEEEYENAMHRFFQDRPNAMWGFELVNPEGECEYDKIYYNRNVHTLEWGGYSIDVDPTASVDANIDALYDEILANGYDTDMPDENEF